jgi:hypothetical protein
MKIDLVIHSSDSNPFYLDFWPLVSKVWHVRFGLRPVLVYIDENHDIPIDTTYGDVLKMKPIPDIPLYLQCQWVRFWIPSQFPDKVCLLSDIDMFPVSRNYFINQIAGVPDTKYIHLNPSHQYIPVCYHLAKGSTFTRVLALEPNWEDSIRNLYAKNMGHDCFAQEPSNLILKNKLQWGADEEYTTQKIREYPDQGIFVMLPRYHGRLDRSYWVWSPRQIVQDAFADAHSIRPYSAHRQEVDKLVKALIE